MNEEEIKQAKVALKEQQKAIKVAEEEALKTKKAKILADKQVREAKKAALAVEKAAKPRKPRNFGGYGVTIDTCLSQVIGVPVGTNVTPPAIAKGVWDYIKAHNLGAKGKITTMAAITA